MSKISNQVVSIWKVVEAESRCIVNQEPIVQTAQDTRTCVDAVCLWLLGTIDVLTRSGNSSTRWIRPLSHVIRDIGLLHGVSSLKAIDHTFLLWLEEGAIDGYVGFKHRIREELSLSGQLIAPIKPLFASLSTSEWCYASIKDIRYYLCFLSRLNLMNRKDLEDKALADYLRNEEALSDNGGCSIAAILEEWFPRDRRQYFFDHFDPWHGPGSVADSKRDVDDKFCHMHLDNRLHYLLNKIEDGHELPRPWIPSSVDFRASKVVFVPKSADKLRTICMEPTSLQYCQQGALHAIQDWAENHPYLRKRFSLTSRYEDDPQNPNRELAFLGSLNGEYATIDLSAASDSVSWSLVRRVFSNTALREILWCTRSHLCTLPTGQTIPSGKFAPMGSALCFPIECIIFAAIVESTLRNLGEDSRYSQYRVFGDDIIVETDFCLPVIEQLEFYGFRVNMEKSFFRSDIPHFFRESCGGDYLDGYDITPLRISRRFQSCQINGHHPSRVEGLIEMTNRSFHFPLLRRYLIQKLNRLPKSLRVPFSTDGEVGVFSNTCTNFHLIKKWSDDYQCFVYRYGSSCVKTRDPEEFEDIRYYAYLRQVRHRERLLWPEDQILATTGPIHSRKWSSNKGILVGSYSQNPRE